MKLHAKKRFSVLVALLYAAICIIPSGSAASAGTVSNSGGVIANHNCAKLTEFKSIPEEWVLKAKSDLHIVYGHTSHGSQVTYGMTELVSFAGDMYAWNNGGTSGALDLRDGENGFTTDLGNSDWDAYTDSYLKSNSDINVVMWSWCGQVSWYSESDINNYLSSMTKLEETYPDVTFVYMTGHLDGTGKEGNLNLRNEQIRKYCKDNNKVLYDFADIESYDPDGNYYLDRYANDNCDYDSNGDQKVDKNWATSWQNAHVQNVDWFECYTAHSQSLNGNMKAYSAWWLWATLAGWDGNSGTKLSGDADNNGTVNAADVACMKKYILGKSIEISTENADLNSDKVINSLDTLLLLRKLTQK